MTNKTLVVILAIIIIMAFGGTQFIGTFFTLCENNEPLDTLTYDNLFQNVLKTDKNPLGTVTIETTDRGSFDIKSTRYTYETGEIQLHDTGILGCVNYVNAVAGEKITSTTNEKNVYIAGDKYYWCGKNNTLTFSSTEQGFNDYLNVFVACETITLTEEEQANRDLCFNTGGTYIDTCKCPVGQAFKENGCQGITQPRQIQKTTFIQQLDVNLTKVLLMGFIIIFSVFIIFEQGGERGIFRRR